MIIHLNDIHTWTRDQIADWLDTLGEFPLVGSLEDFKPEPKTEFPFNWGGYTPDPNPEPNPWPAVALDALEDQISNSSMSPVEKMLYAFRALFKGYVNVEPVYDKDQYYFVFTIEAMHFPTVSSTGKMYYAESGSQPDFDYYEVVKVPPLQVCCSISGYDLYTTDKKQSFVQRAVYYMQKVLHKAKKHAPEPVQTKYLKHLQKVLSTPALDKYQAALAKLGLEVEKHFAKHLQEIIFAPNPFEEAVKNLPPYPKLPHQHVHYNVWPEDKPVAPKPKPTGGTGSLLHSIRKQQPRLK